MYAGNLKLSSKTFVSYNVYFKLVFQNAGGLSDSISYLLEITVLTDWKDANHSIYRCITIGIDRHEINL